MIAYLLLTTLVTAPMAVAKPLAEEKAEKTEKKERASSPVIGDKAPTFELEVNDGSGNFDLSDYLGKTVVLEWFNPACPFVVAAHEGEGALVDLPAKHISDEVVWVAINSTSEGNKGFKPDENEDAKMKWKMDYPILRDPSGEVGRMYNARTTPHMFIVGPKGNLIYDGAVDNQPRGKGERAYTNYVANALKSVQKDMKVKTSKTKPYGCSVKYAD